jgi:hypothetical protein
MMGVEDQVKKGVSNTSDLDQASTDRLDDSRALIVAGRPASAIASALYALEIRLKVLICKRLDRINLPDAFKFHDLEALLILTGLSRRLDDPLAARVKQNWDLVVDLAKNIDRYRYLPDKGWNIPQATTLISWLEDPNDGVITWLKAQP